MYIDFTKHHFKLHILVDPKQSWLLYLVREYSCEKEHTLYSMQAAFSPKWKKKFVKQSAAKRFHEIFLWSAYLLDSRKFSTVRKFQNVFATYSRFYVKSVLVFSRSSKSAIFSIFEPQNFEFGNFSHSRLQKLLLIKIQSLKKRKNDRFWNSRNIKIEFT